MQIIKSCLCFFLAGLCELSGAYLIWQWWRNGKSMWLAFGAAILLVGYGIVNTLQPANFGRSFAAYGGVFIAMAVAWGWLIDKTAPDRYDLVGVGVCLIGAGIIMFAPR